MKALLLWPPGATLGLSTKNRLEERLNVLTQPKLLIIDEIGYILIDRQGATSSSEPVIRAWARGARRSATR